MNLVVYFILYFVMIFSSYKSSNKKNIWRNHYIYIAIITYSLVVGLRWNVGIDYPVYFSLIKGYMADYELERIEFFPRMMMFAVQNMRLPFYYWFVAMSLIQIICLYVAVNKLCKRLLPWCTFFFLFLFLDSSLNIVRQGTALTVALCAIVFFQEKKKLVAFVFLCFAYGFHHSSAIILFVFLIARIERIFSLKWQIAIFSLSIVIGQTLLPVLMEKLSSLASLFGYESAFERAMDNSWKINRGSGLVVIINYLFYYYIIINSNKIKARYENTISKDGFILMYNMFFIGICFYSATMYNMYLARLAMYFNISYIVIMSACIYCNFRQNQVKKIISMAFVLMYITVLILTSVFGKEWQFVWDTTMA